MAFTGAHFGHGNNDNAANAAANSGLGNPPTIGTPGWLTPPVGAGVQFTANTVQGNMDMSNMPTTAMRSTISRHNRYH